MPIVTSSSQAPRSGKAGGCHSRAGPGVNQRIEFDITQSWKGCASPFLVVFRAGGLALLVYIGVASPAYGQPSQPGARQRPPCSPRSWTPAPMPTGAKSKPDCGLRPRPFPDGTASLPPGLLAGPGPDFHRQATTSLRTRRNTVPLRHGVTSRSAGRTRKPHCALRMRRPRVRPVTSASREMCSGIVVGACKGSRIAVEPALTPRFAQNISTAR